MLSHEWSRVPTSRPSHVFRWDGSYFHPFQDVPSRWAYNWHAFAVDGTHFLAHADHTGPLRLFAAETVTYRFTGPVAYPSRR